MARSSPEQSVILGGPPAGGIDWGTSNIHMGAGPSAGGYDVEIDGSALKHPVFDTPVITLLDLWVSKYGYLWVEVDAVKPDPFYSLAYQRLKALGELEVHYLSDRSIYVCRRPER